VVLAVIFVYNFVQGAREREATDELVRRTSSHLISVIEHCARHGVRGVRREDVIANLTTVGTYGWGFTEGAEISVALVEGGMAICPDTFNAPPKWIPWHELHELEVGGPGVQVTDAGLIGGGFGFWGAVQGIAVAHYVNEKTREVSVSTLLQIRSEGGGMLLHSTKIPPERLAARLGPALGALAARRANPVGGGDVAGQIERLAALRRDGEISEEEFQAAKRKLLG
jgi:hypothetical protein